ncbi:MAG: hypothetical protein KGI69_00740 [Patescibacteria group bacterium]|nr:hypothetical protein [Patescibacteria group bacterium]
MLVQNQALVSYIRTQLNSGVPLDLIKAAAKRAGWTDMDINEALSDKGSRPTPVRAPSAWWKPALVVIVAAALAAFGWWRLQPQGSLASFLPQPAGSSVPVPAPSPSSTAPAAAPAASSIPSAPSSALLPVSSATSASASSANRQLFSSSPYYDRSYLIYPGTPSAAAQRALDGFVMTTHDAGNGTTAVTLTSKAGDYPAQTYSIGPGSELFFVETSMGDDQPSQDYAYGDDFGVVVDQNGYIVSQ